MRREYKKKVSENMKKNANIKKVVARARLRTEQLGKVQKMGAAAKVLFTVAWSRPFCMVTHFLGEALLGNRKTCRFLLSQS